MENQNIINSNATSGNIYIFYHIYCNENTLDIIKDQINKIIFSDLYQVVDKIFCFFTGPGEFLDICKDYVILCGNKFFIADFDCNDTTYERFTLLRIPKYIKPNDKFLYIHSKGVTKNNKYEKQFISDWRTYMEYFLIKKYKDCIKLLDIYDTVGVNYSIEVNKHYSGNFWWTKGSYYLKLPNEIEDGYLAPELYLLKANANSCNLFTSTINHYKNIFTFQYYIDIENNKYDEYISNLLKK